MFRPMIVAPTLPRISLAIGVLALTSPPAPPCPSLNASSETSHRCSCSPPTPLGSSAVWSGPATKPSSDIVMVTFTLLIALLLEPCPSSSCRALYQPDCVSLGIAELRQLHPGMYPESAGEPCAAEPFGLREGGLDVGDLDVEGHVAAHASRRAADAAADSDARDIRLALDDAITQRVGGVDRPTEQVAVEAAQPVTVGAHDLELNDRTTHLLVLSFPRAMPGVSRLADSYRAASIAHETTDSFLGESARPT